MPPVKGTPIWVFNPNRLGPYKPVSKDKDSKTYKLPTGSTYNLPDDVKRSGYWSGTKGGTDLKANNYKTASDFSANLTRSNLSGDITANKININTSKDVNGLWMSSKENNLTATGKSKVSAGLIGDNNKVDTTKSSGAANVGLWGGGKQEAKTGDANDNVLLGNQGVITDPKTGKKSFDGNAKSANYTVDTGKGDDTVDASRIKTTDKSGKAINTTADIKLGEGKDTFVAPKSFKGLEKWKVDGGGDKGDTFKFSGKRDDYGIVKSDKGFHIFDKKDYDTLMKDPSKISSKSLEGKGFYAKGFDTWKEGDKDIKDFKANHDLTAKAPKEELKDGPPLKKAGPGGSEKLDPRYEWISADAPKETAKAETPVSTEGGEAKTLAKTDTPAPVEAEPPTRLAEAEKITPKDEEPVRREEPVAAA